MRHFYTAVCVAVGSRVSPNRPPPIARRSIKFNGGLQSVDLGGNGSGRYRQRDLSLPLVAQPQHCPRICLLSGIFRNGFGPASLNIAEGLNRLLPGLRDFWRDALLQPCA